MPNFPNNDASEIPEFDTKLGFISKIKDNGDVEVTTYPKGITCTTHWSGADTVNSNPHGVWIPPKVGQSVVITKTNRFEYWCTCIPRFTNIDPKDKSYSLGSMYWDDIQDKTIIGNESGANIILDKEGKITIQNNDETLVSILRDLVDVLKNAVNNATKTLTSGAGFALTSATGGDVTGTINAQVNITSGDENNINNIINRIEKLLGETSKPRVLKQGVKNTPED